MTEKLAAFLRTLSPLDVAAIVLGLLASGVVIGIHAERTRLYNKFRGAAQDKRAAAEATKPAPADPAPAQPA